MRLVQVLVPPEQLDLVCGTLTDEDVDYVVLETDRAPKGGSLVQFPLPNGAVGAVLDGLRDAGFDPEERYEVFTDATLAETEHFSDVVERYETEPAFSGLARTELHAKVREMTWSALSYYATTFLSVLVAGAGLLLDSVALVIGAMVIAPQVSTALSTSVGLLTPRWQTFRRGATNQVLGLGLSIVGATVLAWLARAFDLVPALLDVKQLDLMRSRLSPNAVSTGAAFAAGAAGAFGFATAQTTSLVGVMVAAALIPAAAAAGIGLAWGLPDLVVGALLLLGINLVAVNVGSFAMLHLLGYATPERTILDVLPEDRRLLAKFGVALLVTLTVGVVAGSVQQSSFAATTNQEVEQTLEDPAYASLELVGVRTTYAGPGLGSGAPTVSVTVSRPADRPYPDLAPTLQRRIEAATDREVRVEVTFVDTDAAG